MKDDLKKSKVEEDAGGQEVEGGEPQPSSSEEATTRQEVGEGNEAESAAMEFVIGKTSAGCCPHQMLL